MKIERKEKYTPSEWWAYLRMGVGIYVIALATFLLSFGAEVYFRTGSELSAQTPIQYLLSWQAVWWSLVAGIVVTLIIKTKLIFKQKCIVCGELKYTDAEDIVITNQNEVKKDFQEVKLACKAHKKPYISNLPLTNREAYEKSYHWRY